MLELSVDDWSSQTLCHVCVDSTRPGQCTLLYSALALLPLFVLYDSYLTSCFQLSFRERERDIYIYVGFARRLSLLVSSGFQNIFLGRKCKILDGKSDEVINRVM